MFITLGLLVYPSQLPPVLGVGLVLQSVPGLLTLMLVGGALYLGWIGGSLVRGASALGEVGASRSRPARSAGGARLGAFDTGRSARRFHLCGDGMGDRKWRAFGGYGP